jgi:L-lactate permease
MSITRAEQMSMNPVFAADSVGASAARVVMPGGIGVSSSSVGLCGAEPVLRRL